jgi:hypothetical protein
LKITGILLGNGYCVLLNLEQQYGREDWRTERIDFQMSNNEL